MASQFSTIYAPLAAVWGVAGIPSGVTGTPITNGMTEAQQLAAIATWTVTGTIPSTIYISGPQLSNCINWSELAALTDAQRKDVLDLCLNPGPLLGGSANTSFLTAGMIIAYFPTSRAITSGTYNNATGVVTLTMALAIGFGAGGRITVSGLTGTGAFASLNDIFPTISPTSGTTVTYNAGAGHGASTITGGSIVPPTITELTALAKGTSTEWWRSVGLFQQPNHYDLIAAGIVTVNPTFWTYTAKNKRFDPGSKNNLIDIAYQQFGSDGITATTKTASDTLSAVTLTDNDVYMQALRRIVNVFLPGDDSLAALTSS